MVMPFDCILVPMRAVIQAVHIMVISAELIYGLLE
jgi:hypothetical protein